jgi:2-polyprenyl-3-methyl-5-hydroxy-6-metoxy-1,4-benzoquinol methylase
MEYEYKWLPGTLVPPDLLEQLASLYSDHYGTWSLRAPHNQGRRVRMSPQRVGKLLVSDEAKLAYATLNNTVVGYAIAIQAKVPEYGFISWVTQLVVHEDHRRKDVGRSLLFAIWTFTDHFAWGLLTANPYAIRALEKATRRRCQPVRIARNHRKLRTVALEYVPYVKEKTEIEVTKEVSRINTQFLLDHATLPAMLESVISPSVPWELGSIEEGWEWFAFTFNDQKEIDLTPEEIETMLKSSDQVAKRAYSRMLLNKGHHWVQHSKAEAQFIASLCDLKPGAASILDFGCGTGRHALELASMGLDVTGIDYLDNFVGRARENAAEREIAHTQFKVGDCRQVNLGRQFDLVLCLYDVIGTYADEKENTRIVENITRHLRPGGKALISVMNLELTQRRAKHSFSLAKEPNRLLALKPSRTMEQTGDIFDPDYYMLDRETNIVYRKEQFAAGTSLPAELIVRDRRYRREDIEMICKASGLDVLWSRFVHSGCWDDSLEHDNDRAKEILVFCNKP